MCVVPCSWLSSCPGWFPALRRPQPSGIGISMELQSCSDTSAAYVAFICSSPASILYPEAHPLGRRHPTGKGSYLTTWVRVVSGVSFCLNVNVAVFIIRLLTPSCCYDNLSHAVCFISTEPSIFCTCFSSTGHPGWVGAKPSSPIPNIQMSDLCWNKHHHKWEGGGGVAFRLSYVNATST